MLNRWKKNIKCIGILLYRCPVTNRAWLEHPQQQQSGSPGKMKSALGLSPLKLSSPVKTAQRGSPVKGGGRSYDILGHGPRVPLLALSSNNQCNRWEINLTAKMRIVFQWVGFYYLGFWHLFDTFGGLLLILISITTYHYGKWKRWNNWRNVYEWKRGERFGRNRKK